MICPSSCLLLFNQIRLVLNPKQLHATYFLDHNLLNHSSQFPLFMTNNLLGLSPQPKVYMDDDNASRSRGVMTVSDIVLSPFHFLSLFCLYSTFY